jgi:hypothetical protein
VPPTLAQIAEGLEARARALWDEGKREAAWEVMGEVVKLLKAWGTMKGLPERYQFGNVGKMVNAERVRHSKGQGDVDPLVAAANAHHYTLRSLAENLGVSHALLSQARKGTRSIEKSLAEKVEKLTGFPATRGNWPKLKG